MQRSITRTTSMPDGVAAGGSSRPIKGRENAVGVAAIAGPSPEAKPRVRVPGHRAKWESGAALANAMAEGINSNCEDEGVLDSPYGNLYAALEREQAARQVPPLVPACGRDIIQLN